MTARTPAPGRVVVSCWLDFDDGEPPEWEHVFYGICKPCNGRPFDDWPTITAAADALREHLRTEHADLWQVCPWCHGLATCCRTCHGRGYVEALQYCGRGICCLEDGHEGKCTT